MTIASGIIEIIFSRYSLLELTCHLQSETWQKEEMQSKTSLEDFYRFVVSTESSYIYIYIEDFQIIVTVVGVLLFSDVLKFAVNIFFAFTRRYISTSILDFHVVMPVTSVFACFTATCK